MILLQDTRQQYGKHRNIEAYCKRMGIQIVNQCLSVGDYMLPGRMVSVDTKENILELASNVMSSDHRRFKAECVRAQEQGIQLIILVEEVPPYGRLDMWEVPRWQSSNKWHRYGDPMTLVDPAALRKACITMQKKYGVKFRFCSRLQSPKRVIQYLKGELK
ncbi:MAG: ERCC4 domain-containing protein [Oscillospiraceae bacterium]|nr:ERCC4 domain-containing protein [Oscillospiraceae bacterium]